MASTSNRLFDDAQTTPAAPTTMSTKKESRATPQNQYKSLPPQLTATLLSTKKENHMNWDRIHGNWKQVTGKAKIQWGKLTDDDFDVINGQRDQLAGKIQERYGIAKEEAEKQVSEWQHKANESWFSKN